MPVFVEDPAQFSKQRLKLELVANNVVLPPGEKKKRVYLDLYMKHVFQKSAADFSSDEEDQVYGNDVEDPSVQEEEEEQQEEEEEVDEMDVALLTDDELRARLLQFGVKAGPIVASSRGLYEKKLQRLLAPALQPNQNGTQEEDQYSDIEEDGGDEEEDEPGCEAEHPVLEPVAVAGVTSSKHGQLGSKRVRLRARESENYYFPQCFTLPSRMRVNHAVISGCTSAWDAEPQGNCSANAEQPAGPGLESRRLQSSSRAAPESRSGQKCESRPRNEEQVGLGRMDKCTTTSRSTLAGPGASLHRLQQKGPVPDVLTEMFPDTDQTLTGISATRRRPIKGAAGRPVQYKYPETPLSPATMESIELRQRLVPVWVQVLVFLGVAALLYLIYGLVEDGLESPIATLLDNLSPGAEPNEVPPPLPELQDNPAHLLPEEY
ncbi:hypothetical protein GJAV_G00189710 [Gymnothorax javanicus]|nr:hypothetical protein GJAV_G00189710 [Gymnothorax javanicus]